MPHPSQDATAPPELSDYPDRLRDRSGATVFRSHTATSLSETIAEYREHVDDLTRRVGSYHVHRAMLREVTEVIEAHVADFDLAERAVEIEQRLIELGPEPRTPGGMRGLVGRVRAPAAEKRLAADRAGLKTQHNLLSRAGQDPHMVLAARGDMEMLRSDLYARAQTLRNWEVDVELAAAPEWAVNALGERPVDAVEREVWEATAADLAGRRIDLGITDPEYHGLDHQARQMGRLAEARLALNIDAAAPRVEQELGLSLT